MATDRDCIGSRFVVECPSVQRNRERDRDRESQRNRDKDKDKEGERQGERERDRQTDRQAGRQTDKKTHTVRLREKDVHVACIPALKRGILYQTYMLARKLGM